MKNLNHLLYRAANASTVRPELLACVLLVAALIGATSQALAAAAGSLVPSAPKGKQTEAAAKTLLKLPLRFEGTADRQAMVVHLGDRRLLLGKAGSVDLKSGTGPALSIELEGANRESFPVGQDRLPGKSNYFLGNDPSRWRKGVEQFSQARVKDVYSGVDLLYYGNGTELEHDYILAPGSDPSVFRMSVSGGKTVIDPKTGDLIVSQSDTSDELIRLVRPVAYQKAADGSRKDVAAQYARNENGSFGFALGTYDHTLPLTIDPVLNYSTYFGGNNEDRIVDIKTNLAGDIYLLVRTLSTDLPVPSQIPGACNDVCGPANSSPFPTYYSPSPYDMYIAKLDNTGQKLIFSSYIGGTGQDFPSSLALAPDGTICIAGLTDSQDFPIFNGYASTFPLRLNLTSTLTRLSANGSDILYSTFIGSDNSVSVLPFYANFTAPYTVAAGPDGIAYLLGGADTIDGNPGTFLDAKNSTFTQGGGSFIAKFDTTKTGYDSLVYAKVFGQPGDQSGYVLESIAIDSKQDVWAFGLGASNAPVTADAIQSVCDGGPKCHNGYLFAMDPTGEMVYGTFVGGTPNASGVPQNETPEAMVIDASDNVYISGLTDSQGMPVVNGVYSFTPLNLYSPLGGFLIKLSPGGKSILYSTYTGFDPAVMSAGAGGLVTANSIEGEIHQTNPLGDAIELETNDAFVAFDTTKSGLPSIVSVSHLAPADYGYVLTPLASAIDAQGNMLVVGFTSDPVLPLVKPFQSTCAMCGSVVEGFVERVQLVDGPPVIGALTLTPTSQSFPNATVGSASSTLSSTLTNATDSAISLSYGTLSDISDFSVAGNCPAIILSSTSCTLNFTFKPQSAGALSATYSIYDLSNASSPLNVALTGTGTAPATPKASLTPAALTFGSVAIAHTGTAQTVTLANPGGAALAITSVGLSGTNAGDYSIAANTCGTSLAAGASCTVTLNFTPAAVGTRAATLSVVDKVGTQTASLTGTGIVHPIAIAPASFDFGQVTVGDYKTQAFTLTNVSSAPADIDLPSITESGISFEFSSSVICGTIAPGASCTIQVKFSPTAAGTYSASLNVTDSGGPQTAALAGTGVAPLVTATLMMSSIDFGTKTIGVPDPINMPTLFQFTNTGQVPIIVKSITVTGSGFSLGANTCGAAIAPGDVCYLSAYFVPVLVGRVTGAVTVISNAGTNVSTLAGTGVAPPASTPFINFGAGFTTDALTFNGPATVTGGALQLTAGPSITASSAFYPTAVPTSAFTSDFTFQLLDPTAEGITFTIQADSPNAVGLGGGGLGYQGLAKSIAVKFDLKDTAGEGVDSTGIYVNGAAPTIPATSLVGSSIDLHSGHVFDLRLTYDGTTMSVSLTDTVTGTIWTTQVAEDIPAIVGGSTAYFGFTAGSGIPTHTSDATDSARAESERPAATASASTPPPATSRILTWIYVATGETKTAQTISFSSLSGTTYGAAPITLAATATSGLPVSYTVTGPAKLSGSTLTITGVGEVSVTATQPGNASFASATPVTRSFAVAKAPLTVIANSLSRAFGAANPAFTYELSGFVNGDGASAVSGTATLATTASVTSPSGSYPITFSTEGLTAANYSFNYLAGTLTVTPGTLVIAPASGNFGIVKVGTTSPVISFTVTNDTASTMGYLGYANLGEFYLQPGTCHLVNGEPMLNPGKSCVFTAVFKPTKAGPVSGNLSIQTSSGTFNIPMSGTGATLVISPASGNFGSVKIGQTSPVMSFTVTNDTASTMGYLGYANLGEFYLQPGTCHLVNGEPMLNPGKSCVFTAVFKPTKAGAASGNMSIQTSSGTFNVPMSGTGATP
jgi:hypothetical protein